DGEHVGHNPGVAAPYGAATVSVGTVVPLPVDRAGIAQRRGVGEQTAVTGRGATRRHDRGRALHAMGRLRGNNSPAARSMERRTIRGAFAAALARAGGAALPLFPRHY